MSSTESSTKSAKHSTRYKHFCDEDSEDNDENVVASKNTQKTQFEDVIDFMTQFGQTTYDNPQVSLLKNDEKLKNFRLSLIDEEVSELKEACKNNDFIEVIDACGDILYVVFGMCATYGININEAFRIIHESNMSKLCKSEEEARETVEWYKQNDKRYDSPAYKLCNDTKHWMVYNESTKKVLKSINYTPANFNTLMKKVD